MIFPVTTSYDTDVYDSQPYSSSPTEQSPPSDASGRPDKPKSAPAQAKTDTGPSKAQVRKVAQATIDIAEASPTRREMVVSLLGLRRSADVVAIVVAIVAADAGVTAPIAALLSVIEQSDPMEATIAAVELAEDRELGKAVWSLLSSLDAVSGSLPPVAAKAGLALVKAASALEETKVAELTAVASLLR